MDSIILFKIRQDKHDYQDIPFVFINFQASRAIVLKNQDDGGKNLMKPNPPSVERRTSRNCLFT